MIIKANSLNFNPINKNQSAKPFAPKEDNTHKGIQKPIALNSNKTYTQCDVSKIIKQLPISTSNTSAPIRQDVVEFTAPANTQTTELQAFDLMTDSTGNINWQKVNDSITTGYAWHDYHKQDCSFYMTDIAEYLGNMSELYSTLETRINNDFTGEEKTQQLKILNDTFQKAVDNYANEYMGRLKIFVNLAGTGFPENEIRESIYGIFAGKSDTPFSANDLQVLNHVVANAVLSPTNHNIGTLGRTDTVGLDLSLIHLSAMEMMDRLGVSAQMKDTINNFLDLYTENMIKVAERFEQTMQRNSEMLGRIGKSSLYTHNPNIRDDIMAVVNLTKELYSKEKTTLEIIQAVCALSYEQNKDNPSDFWKGFYDNGNGKSIVGGLIEKWNAFSTALDSGDNKRITDTMREVSNLFVK